MPMLHCHASLGLTMHGATKPHGHCDWRSWNMHDENYDVLLHLGTSYNIRVASTVARDGDWSSVSARQEVKHIRHTWMQAAQGLYGYSQWSCRNCSCGVSYATPHEKCHNPNRGPRKCYGAIVLSMQFANSRVSTLELSSSSHNILWTDGVYFMREDLFYVHSRPLGTG
jgi:hypothetical protein